MHMNGNSSDSFHDRVRARLASMCFSLLFRPEVQVGPCEHARSYGYSSDEKKKNAYDL